MAKSSLFVLPEDPIKRMYALKNFEKQQASKQADLQVYFILRLCKCDYNCKFVYFRIKCLRYLIQLRKNRYKRNLGGTYKRH